MIEYHLDFDGDWEIWQNLCRAFRAENGYFELTELPGWVRATEPYVHNIQLYETNSKSKTWAVVYFLTEADRTAFLLKWT